MSEILKVENLFKRFGRKNVLTDLSMSLDKGKVYGLLGNNGEGKTTLARIILGIIPSDSGRIAYNGKPVTYSGAAYKKTIGYIAEDCIFFRRMSVGEVLRFNSAFYPTWSTQKADDYVNRFGLDKKDRVGKLSRGQKLKLGFVVALAASPELLILDDPTSGLDVPTRHDFLRDIIRELTEEAKTVLFASHLVHELERVIDHLAILHGGRLILDRPFEEVKGLIKRVRITAGQAAVEALGSQGILSRASLGSQWELVVYPYDETFQARLAAAGCASAEVEAMSLEEIFVSFVA